jgi:hypothetical protein
MGLPPKEWPMCTRRYAAASATGAISLTGSHNRMAAQEPGRRRPVKAASRRSRSRIARALTGPRAFYLAIARSAVSSSPFLRGPSPNCDQTKTRPSATGAGSAHVRCSRYAESLVTARASRVAKSTEARTQERRLQCWVFAVGRRKTTSGSARRLRPAVRFDDRRPHDRRAAGPPNCHEGRCVSFPRPAPCSSSSSVDQAEESAIIMASKRA